MDFSLTKYEFADKCIEIYCEIKRILGNEVDAPGRECLKEHAPPNKIRTKRYSGMYLHMGSTNREPCLLYMNIAEFYTNVRKNVKNLRSSEIKEVPPERELIACYIFAEMVSVFREMYFRKLIYGNLSGNLKNFNAFDFADLQSFFPNSKFEKYYSSLALEANPSFETLIEFDCGAVGFMAIIIFVDNTKLRLHNKIIQEMVMGDFDYIEFNKKSK